MNDLPALGGEGDLGEALWHWDCRWHRSGESVHYLYGSRFEYVAALLPGSADRIAFLDVRYLRFDLFLQASVTSDLKRGQCAGIRLDCVCIPLYFLDSAGH